MARAGKSPKVGHKGPEKWTKMWGKGPKKSEPDTMPDKPRKVGDPTMKGAREKNARAKRMEGKLI